MSQFASLRYKSAAVMRRSSSDRGVYAGSDGVHPELHKWWLLFQENAADYGVPLRVVSGFRTKDEQNALKAKGFSRASFPNSPHNHGLALDIIHMEHAYSETMTPQMWRLLSTIGFEVARKRNLKLEWGGNWGADWSASPPRRGWDPAHWQFADWKSMRV